MYTGNGNGGNGNGGYQTVGGLRVKSIYLYAALAVVIFIAAYFLINLFNTTAVTHFGLVAGVLLLLVNLRELLGSSFAQRTSTALLNCLIGGALLCAWVSQVFTIWMWVPAVALIVIAIPLALGRASVYSTYVGAARTAVNSARRGFGR